MATLSDFSESNILYRAKNYAGEYDGFTDVPYDYPDKYMYELYYNPDKNIVVVVIQSEFFSCNSLEPIINNPSEFNNPVGDLTGDLVIKYIGSASVFYDFVKGNRDIMFYGRILDKDDVDFDQLSKMYEIFIDHYEKIHNILS